MAEKASEEAGSNACSDSSSCKKDDSDASGSCSEASSNASSSSDQSTSDSGSDKQRCLSKQVCLKKSQPSCSGSSEEQSSSCSESSSCKASDCCLKSEPDALASESASASEDLDSNAAKSSTDATSSEPPLKDEKAGSGGGGGGSSSSSSKAPKEGKSSGAAKEARKGDGQSGWSLSEDALLRSMKEADDGLSWEDIGRALNRGKNECKGRWKAIRDQKPEMTPDEVPPADGAAAVAAAATDGPAEANPDTNTGAAEPDGDTTNKAAEDGDEQRRAPDGASSTSSRGRGEHERQRRYWHEHIGRYLFPPAAGRGQALRLAPDAHFSAEDCRALEAADARGRGAGRWLDTQARFYNATGRMVPLEVLRRKLAEGYVGDVVDVVDVEGWLDGVRD